MKICNKCGHRNWKIELNDKKKPVCSECGDKLDDSGTCIPIKGMNTGNDNYHCQKIIDSDDI